MNKKNNNNHSKQPKSKENNIEFNLPKSSAKFFLGKENKIELDNMYLLHHRYSMQLKNRKLKNKPDSLLKSIKIPTKDNKIPIKINEDIVKNLNRKLNERTEKLAKLCNFCEPICYKYKPIDKLAIGIGETSPYDSTLLMTLHSLYGTPYLPASAIKGILRSYWHNLLIQKQNLKDKNNTELTEANKKELKSLFGTEEKQGGLIFFDIFPKKYELCFDVLTPHYQKYYQNKEEPTDDQKINILTFPCVKDSEFEIYIAWGDIELWKRYKEKLNENIVNAFNEYGIGAKTAYGYGLGTG
ncbi:MAG: type III-B CRISPR module RAMP protein Cmr6 [Defluviitaleaceae bacterium]|nr:type III-B CRISPR module RAMP protein Cmr6 [Defluviitaleaceae bacterium]